MGWTEGGREGGREGGMDGWMDGWMDGLFDDYLIMYHHISFHDLNFNDSKIDVGHLSNTVCTCMHYIRTTYLLFIEKNLAQITRWLAYFYRIIGSYLGDRPSRENLSTKTN